MQYLALHLVGLSSFKTTSKYMKFCLQMNKKGRLVASYSLISLMKKNNFNFGSSVLLIVKIYKVFHKLREGNPL